MTKKKIHIPIDRDIPMPPAATGEGRAPAEYSYPWAFMRVGESFLAPDHIPQYTVSRLAVGAAKRFGLKFATRNTPDGVRVWRIE